MFTPEREEVIGGWSKLHNEECPLLALIKNIITVMKPSIRLAGYMAYIGPQY
jgi:hypothetical protein